MRVVFIITGLAYGGAETQLMHLALSLRARGWEVRIVSLTQPKTYVEELASAGIPLVSLDIRRKLPDPLLIFRFARLIRAWQPQIVHSHMVHANLFARLVRPIASVPVLICTAHNINEGGRIRELLYGLTDPLCDLTTQVSRAGLDRYVRVGAVPDQKICHIPNGVDTGRFCPDPAVRRSLRADLQFDNSFIWLTVGRFNVEKDYPNMLSAFAIVFQKRPETLLLIVGDGPLRPSMMELAKSLGLNDSVRFLGTGHNVLGLMKASDGFVMSSAWEGMPMVILEASATALPVVATDVGGNAELVRDCKTGFLVPPKDHKALAGAMLRMMELSYEERIQMAQAGRKHIEANYSLDRVTKMWETLYMELVSAKGLRKKVL